MGLFDKKFCDFCGDKIGLLGNRKLADGNMCKNCASNISPLLTGRRDYTVEDMKVHLEQREANKARLGNFNATRSLGTSTKVHIDDNQKLLLVTASRKYKDENPDLIEFNQVSGCTLDIDENKTEIKREGADGKQVSYNPPRYSSKYDFYIAINVSHPWCDQIRFKVNTGTIEGRTSIEYRDTKRQANEMHEILQNLHSQIMEDARPQTSVRCSGCGASTLPDENGRCEYCGTAIGA